DRAGGLAAHGLNDVLELLAVLAALDRVDVRADELDAVLLEDARVVERDRGVEGGLTAERGQERIGALLRDDRLYDGGLDRLDVRGIRDVRVRDDRSGIRSHEEDAVALAAQDAAGPRHRVVELAGLADDDGARADDEHGLEVGSSGHGVLSFCAAQARADAGLAVIMSAKRVKRPRESWGPAADSGWNWTENAGMSRHSRPSTTWSLRPMWLTRTRPKSACGAVIGSPVGASTAKPWF